MPEANENRPTGVVMNKLVSNEAEFEAIKTPWLSPRIAELTIDVPLSVTDALATMLASIRPAIISFVFIIFS